MATRIRKPPPVGGFGEGGLGLKHPKGKLTELQRTFIEVYVSRNCNAKEAALAVGSSASTAYQWLDYSKFPHVAIEIERRMEERRNTTEVKAARIIQEAARIGFFDVRRILTPDGNGVENLKNVPEDVAACIKKVRVSYGEETDKDGNYRRLKHVEYEFHDKIAALKMLCDMLGLGEGRTNNALNNISFNSLRIVWDDLYRKSTEPLPIDDPIEKRIEDESRMLPAHTAENTDNSLPQQALENEINDTNERTIEE